MITWLLRKPWWFNLLAMFVLTIAVFFIWLSSLSWFTRHGQTSVVPRLVGLSFTEAKSLLESKGFSVAVDDSVYTDTLPPLHVLKQIPDPDEAVKAGRVIFLTISRLVPPEVELPNLRGQSFRNAEMILKSLDLRVGDTIYRRDFARNAVLEQRYAGSVITPGTRVRKGSRIDLVLGNGLGDVEMEVPDMLGLTFGEAKSRLDELGLGVGVLMLSPDLTDTLSGFVIRQEPMPRMGDTVVNRIRSGQLMDLWLGATAPVRDTIYFP